MNADFLNLQNIFYRIYQFFTGDFSGFFRWLSSSWPLIMAFSFLFGLLLLAIGIYLYRKLNEVKKMDAKVFGTVRIKKSDEEDNLKNERWVSLLSLLDSDSPSDWKNAILEADIILDEMTKKMGYHGDTLGERLNSVEKSDFLTLNLAWEAHKVRNSIAHEGSNFLLSKREAKRVINLYRQVFEEFEFI